MEFMANSWVILTDYLCYTILVHSVKHILCFRIAHAITSRLRVGVQWESMVFAYQPE